MKKEEANRINAILKNIELVATKLDELMMPIKNIMQKNNCTTQQACNIKANAEEYIKQYGKFTLNASINTIKSITNNITQ